MKDLRRGAALLVSALILSTAPAARADESITVTPYGFLAPTIVLTSGEPETFGRVNASAITAAANPVFAPDEAAKVHTLQVAQSRVGIKIQSPHQIQGVVEVDFIDFQKSTPTLAMQPRLRSIAVTKRFGERHRLVAGQLWDLHGYVQPFHANFVGANFQAGNSAFMRLQTQYLYETPQLELGAAVGMPAANVGPSLAELEHNSLPTLAGRALIKLGADQRSRLGASAIVGRVKASEAADLTSWSAALLMDLSLGDWGVRGEAYMAQNGANISLLSLSQGRAGVNVRELGGYVSAKFAATPSHRLTLTAGMASLLNEEDALAAYGYAAPGEAASAKPAQGPGIAQNAHVRAGYSWQAAPGLELIAEPFWLRTTHILDAADATLTPTRQLFGLQTSMVYTF